MGKFPESKHAKHLLSGLKGLEIGGSAHNSFGLDTLNVDYTDAMDTVFKFSEIERCGEAMSVDIVAPGDNIPVANKSFDFVISSHVIEHFFDPIGALIEWARIARHYIYIIVPKRDALPSDKDKPLTPFSELFRRYTGDIPAPKIDTHEHYSRWTLATFCDMCNAIGDATGFEVYDTLEHDDKVGNGFTVVLRAKDEKI